MSYPTDVNMNGGTAPVSEWGFIPTGNPQNSGMFAPGAVMRDQNAMMQHQDMLMRQGFLPQPELFNVHGGQMSAQEMMMPGAPRPDSRQHKSAPVDMGSLPLQDLLGGIKDGLLTELQERAPSIVNALMMQQPSHGIVFQPDTESDRTAGTTATTPKPKENSRKRPSMNSSSEGMEDGSGSGEEQQGGTRKVQRAEKNRLSAARSREKKRVHLDELKRRVAMLSAENAQLQVEQLQVFQEMIEKERRLRQENKQLVMKVDESKERLEDTKNKMKEQGINIENNKRHTWSSGEWQKRN